jgi:hypothetical protein
MVHLFFFKKLKRVYIFCYNKAIVVLKGLEMEKPVVLEGVCHIYSEQGIGPYWSFWESKHIHPAPDHWNFAGLNTLKDGDHLTILNRRDGKTIVWSGFISFWTNRRGKVRQRDVSGKKWTRWFRKEYPAQFTPGPNQKPA